MSTTRRSRCSIVAVVGLILVVAPWALPAAHGQGKGLPALQQQVQQLEATVKTLQAAVAALQSCGIVLSAQADNTPTAGFAVVSSPPVEVNSVSLVASCDGFLVISGSTSVTNNMASAQFYALGSRVDGVDPFVIGGQATVELDAFASNSRNDTLAYTVVVPIAAGAHTISQELGTVLGSAASFAYSRNNFTVLFVPGNQGTLTAAP